MVPDMRRNPALIVFLLDAITIGLGAFGHGLAVRHLHAAIDHFPIEADMHSMLTSCGTSSAGVCSRLV